MSFINWGGESPEHLAARQRAEFEALYEQAIRLRLQAQGGVGGSGGLKEDASSNSYVESGYIDNYFE